jgi:hypothetical protein
MASYYGRVGVVSEAIDTIRSAANKRVPHAAPVSSAFLAKDEEFLQPFQVKNNTAYSKPRPIGNNENPKKYNYVPLNQKPEDCVNEFNVPVYSPPKLEFSDTSNKFMEASAMRGSMDGYENHVEARTLEQMIRTH